jgi:hypothetical protein
MKKFKVVLFVLFILVFGFSSLLMAQANGFQGSGSGSGSQVITSGPSFSVTFPNSNIQFTSGNQMGITWNVAGTNQSPQNIQDIKISLSLDGGLTFPHILVQSTPNDGNELIVVPNLPTIMGRIRISSLNSSLSATSGANFIILASAGRVATPVISPGTGTYNSPFNCIISCATTSTKIYFTTNGNQPVPGSTFTRVYGGPFLVDHNTTVRAIAMRQNFTTSFTGVANFTFPNAFQTAPAPSISHPSGQYTGTQMVSLQNSLPGSAIFYTTTGNVPVLGTSFTRLYTGPFPITSTSTVRAITVASGMNNSPQTVSNLTINHPVQLATPVISPGTGNFTAPVMVSITSATPNVVIFYSTTGNEPIPGAPHTQVYSQPFQVSTSTTIRAMATRQGVPNSPIATSFLTHQMPIAATPVISLPTGTYSGVQTVSLSTSTPGAQIYFTTSGNVPILGTSFTRLYTGPISLTNTTTIRAISVRTGMQNSPVAVSFYSFVGGRKNVDDISEDPQNQPFTLYPNPGTGFVTLKGLETQKEGNQIQVFNALGNMVYSQSLENQNAMLQIDLSNLKPGIYFIKETSSQSMKRWIKK